MTITPSLVYDNAPAALAWLVAAFGFTETFRVPGPGGTVQHAELRLGDGVVMIESAPRPGGGPSPGRVQDTSSGSGAGPRTVSIIGSEPDLALRSPRTLSGVSQGICIGVDDPAAVLATATAAGARIARRLRETDHGPEFSVFDPEGHLWTVGTYRPR